MIQQQKWVKDMVPGVYIHIYTEEQANIVFDYYSQFGYTHRSLDGVEAMDVFPYLKISEDNPKDIVGYLPRRYKDVIQFDEWYAIICNNPGVEIDPDAILSLF